MDPLIQQFLQNNLAISPDAIAFAQRINLETTGFLPIVLWQYGLISLQQLGQLFDWLEENSTV